MKSKLVDMGIKRKDLHASEYPSSPKSDKDYENEKEYPEISLNGAHAEMMGAEDLKEGDVVEQKVRWRVKRHSKTTENGKTRYTMSLCLEKASDCEECEPEKKSKAGAIDEGSGGGDSRALAYIQGRAKSAD